MGLRGRTKLIEERLFFVTTTCYKHLPLLLDDSYYQILSDSLLFVNEKYNAALLAYVFMPNHIHLVIYFHRENRLSDYMRDFKKFTSLEIRKKLEYEKSNYIDNIKYEIRDQKFKIWNDRFDDLYIERRNTLETKIDYIHNNPVKKNFVNHPKDYYWSSAGFYYGQSKIAHPVLSYVDVI